MELLLAFMVIVVSLLLAAWQGGPSRAPRAKR